MYAKIDHVVVRENHFEESVCFLNRFLGRFWSLLKGRLLSNEFDDKCYWFII